MSRRRIVTGFDEQGRSVIVQDGPSPGRMAGGDWEELWSFSQVPASLDDATDAGDVSEFRLVPLPGTIACRFFTMNAEDTPEQRARDQEFFQRLDMAETDYVPGSDPWMHRTPTVDIIVIVSGEADLVLDSGEKARLGPGDSVIQRGTMHGWRQASAEPCVAEHVACQIPATARTTALSVGRRRVGPDRCWRGAGSRRAWPAGRAGLRPCPGPRRRRGHRS
jgi:hypothetical protein